ncbi:MAG: hypothetical protein EP329_25885 [Deltaproteobacteria bacterium]|nr:MAG: hypothetical protein EP329_25885 [Deltaproteobacteria bacterium]
MSRDPLASMFREVVLVLGGVFAVQGTDDETIRRVAAGLERAYRRARGVPLATAAGVQRHPAIVSLLDLATQYEDAG